MYLFTPKFYTFFSLLTLSTPAAGSPTTTLLQLNSDPSIQPHDSHRFNYPLISELDGQFVQSQRTTSPKHPYFRLLTIPPSLEQVSALNPYLDILSPIRSKSLHRLLLHIPLYYAYRLTHLRHADLFFLPTSFTFSVTFLVYSYFVRISLITGINLMPHSMNFKQPCNSCYSHSRSCV